MNNQPSQSESIIKPFLKKLKSNFPRISIIRIDERFTSKIALRTMIDLGLKKSQRQNKLLVDQISATLILQSYLDSK
jgi:putative Holliday junction resolvase